MKLITLRNSRLHGIQALDAIPGLVQNGTLLPSDEIWDPKAERLIRLDSLAFAELAELHHHDSWAHFYDFVYSQIQGFDEYTRLTERLLLTQFSMPCAVLDVGAGTGRLAIPLAHAGNTVTAVEISSGMIAVLREKIRQAGLQERVEVWQGLIQDFDSPHKHNKFQLVVCLQTVLNYLLETADLERFADVAARHTSPTGHLIIDLAQRAAMTGGLNTNGAEIHRVVSVHPLGGDRYRISERCRGRLNGNTFSYTANDWTARYWEPDDVIRVLATRGFHHTRRPEFDRIGVGSTVHVFRKNG